MAWMPGAHQFRFSQTHTANTMQLNVWCAADLTSKKTAFVDRIAESLAHLL